MSDMEIISVCTSSNTMIGDDYIKVSKNEEDVVNQPNHYADTKYECREVASEIFKDLKGIEAIDTFNVFKYIWRWKKKNGLQDLEKAKNYLDHLINFIKQADK